jgi:hypothetical protein
MLAIYYFETDNECIGMQAYFNIIHINTCGKQTADILQTNRVLNPAIFYCLKKNIEQ